MAEDVKHLAALGPRHAATEREHQASQYIEHQFRSAGVQVELDVAGLERAVILPIDTTTTRQTTLYTNAQVAELCARSERLIGFASVDPHQAGASEESLIGTGIATSTMTHCVPSH